MNIQIETGIPIPHPEGRIRRYPELWQMEVGDSVFIPGIGHANICAYCNKVGIKTGFRFTTRKAEKDGRVGVRVWRIV